MTRRLRVGDVAPRSTNQRREKFDLFLSLSLFGINKQLTERERNTSFYDSQQI